jgi:hypothetical protein
MVFFKDVVMKTVFTKVTYFRYIIFYEHREYKTKHKLIANFSTHYNNYYKTVISNYQIALSPSNIF